MQFKRCQIPTTDFHPGLQRNPFKTNNSKISNDPDAVFSPLLTAKCRNRPSYSFLLKLLLSHTGKLLAEVGTDPQLRVLSQISPPCDITKGRDPEQCLLSGTHSLKRGVSNGSGGWTFVIFMEFADRQGQRLIIENHC